MRQSHKSISMRLGLSLFLSWLLVSSTVFLAIPPGSAKADPAAQIQNWFPIGPPSLPVIPSSPLVPVAMPSRTGLLPLGVVRGPGHSMFKPHAAGAQAAQTCQSATVDLKVLVIAADPTDTQTVLPAIRQVLDFQGTPYTVFTASPRPTNPATDRLASLLASGCHGFYEGIILGNGQVAYNDPTAGWQSALTDAEWQALWSYERTFGIRQITWYTYPTAEYGFNPPTAGYDTTSSPISAGYDTSGQSIFSYANTANPLTIQYVWAYLATPLDSNTAPLLQDSNGNALVAIRTYPDGTQNLALTFDGNATVIHDLVLAYGLVNWVTRGLFLGERHVFMTPQVDDIFIDAHVWTEGTPCGSSPEQTSALYRITGDDLQAVINWQGAKQAQSTTQSFRLDLAFNGEGTTGIYDPDTLTPKAVENQALFKWINHTFTHDNLDNATYAKALSEISSNNQTAQDLGLTTYTILNLITPDVSGLNNANAMQAAFDAGVRYVVSDTSQPGYDNPSPNLGRYNPHQPGILMIPRRPNNLFYNVTTPGQWTAEYNCLYRSFWGRDLTYQEILENESGVLLRYVLLGDMDPWMFHETNLRAYDGMHLLLGDLLDRILTKYNGLFVLPLVSPTMDDLGRQMASRMAYNSAGVSASMIPGQSITISSQQQAIVSVTGLNTAGAESYGGQFISHISLNAGETVTIPLNNPPPMTPTPSNTPTTQPTPTSTPLPPTTTPTQTPTATSTPLPPSPTWTPTLTNTPLPPTATPTRTPTQANQAPVASNDSYTMRALDILLIVPAPGVLSNDTDAEGDRLTAILVTNPTRGTLNFNTDGSFTYTPLPSLTSFTDSFTYIANDGRANSNVATVTIQVNVP